MRNIASILVLATFCLSPSTLFAQRLSITPPAVTVIEGDSRDFTMVLSSEPTANVTVTIVRSDGTDVTTGKMELTFTPANWSMPQTVTLTAAEDEDIMDDSGTLILIASGGGYDGDGIIVNPETVKVESLGESIQFNAVLHDQDGLPVTGTAFDWSSVDPSVAVVDSIGKVTTVNFGTTTISASLATVSGTATILVEEPVSNRETLEILFKATGGEKWKNREGWLTDLPLHRWHGVTTDSDGRVTDLLLYENNLTGRIPSEFSDLRELGRLYLGDNFLSGVVPPELGNLTQLRVLTVLDNKDVSGLLPRSLLNLDLLEYIDIRGTGVCLQQDAESLEWWGSIPGREAYDCTPEQVERLALMELHDKTNGTSWTNALGWGGDTPLGTWHGVTVENGRVTELSLPDNALEGSIPGEVANFTELSVLNLANNSLAGTLSKEIALLPDLTELRVNGNTDLEGALRDDFVNLENLEMLHFGGTSLCVPPTQRFQAWYAGIGDVSGALCSNPAEVRLDIPAVYLTQSVQTPQNSVRLIEGRDALLRVFVTGDRLAFFKHEVVATVRGGGRTHRVEMTRGADRLVMEVDESDLANSFNAVIPGDVITPGATLVVEVDPDGVIPRAVGSRDRFPAMGEDFLQVVSVPVMELIVVPVLEANQPDSSIFDWTDKISDDSPEVGVLRYAFPFLGFRATSRGEAHVTSLDLGWDSFNEWLNLMWRLLGEMEALRFLDNASAYYYGAGANLDGGLATVSGWASVGEATDENLTHEVGHNLSLNHTSCGGAGGVDPYFPYPGGSIGAWGYDFRDGSLISPRYYKDIMGYCVDYIWLSDYHYEKVIDYRGQVQDESGLPMAGAVRESDVLVLWGGVQGGELQIEPLFSATAPARLPETDGPYRLEGLGENTILFSLSFTPRQDKYGNKYFFFAIPIEQDWEESMDRIVLTGPEGNLTVGADDQRTLSIVRDANTGQVRAILRDWDGVLPAALESANNLRITTIQSLSDAVRLQR